MDILLKTQKVIETLRGPNGCPWDKKQTFKTLSPHIIEEAYELCQALEESSMDNLKEESGDFLLQVLLSYFLTDVYQKSDNHGLHNI